MGFKEILLSGAKLLRTSLGVPIPVEDLLRGLFSLIEKIDQLEEDEVLKVALYWALYKAVEDSLKELTENTAPPEELQKAIKNLFRELDKRLNRQNA